MSSVWKRIQRVGKRASKFQFIASYQTLTLECSRDGKWQPNKLSVVWTRRNRRMAVKPETWQPSIANPFRGVIVWTEPEEVEISVTLYKDAREGSPFEDKLWTFVIEDESITGKRRPVASVSVNMVDYHSLELQTFCLNLPLRPASKKVVSASLDLNLACVLLKEGNATDEDMISMSSLLSLNDPYGSREFDYDGSHGGKNFKRNAHKRLSLRSNKSKSKPTFNLASTAESPKQPKKNVKSKEKSGKNDKLNMSLPVANHSTSNGLNKLLSTSDPDLSKVVNRSTFEKPKKKDEQISAPEQNLLKWCQECVADYPNVSVDNMTTSWRNGLAFCAIIHHFNPEMIDFSSLKPDDIRGNNRLAFEAFDYLGISRMLDPHQMVLSSVPDKLLIMTYLHQIKQYFTTRKTTAENAGRDGDITMATIAEAEQSLRLNTETLINDMNDFTKLKNRESHDSNIDTPKGDTEMDTPKDYTKTDAPKGDTKTDTPKGGISNIEYEANPGYNPFDEDDPMAEDDSVSGSVPGNVEGGKSEWKANEKKENLVKGKPQHSLVLTSSEKLDTANGEVDAYDKNRGDGGKASLKENVERRQEGNVTAVEKFKKYSQNNDNVVTESSRRTSSNYTENSHSKTNDKSPQKIVDAKEKQSLQGKDMAETKSKELENAIENPPPIGNEDNKSLQTTGKNTAKTSKNDSTRESSVLYSPKPSYNPFLDEEAEGLGSRTSDIEKPTSSNPFDDDYVDDVTEPIQGGGELDSSNPFHDDYEEPVESDLDKVLDESGWDRIAGACDSKSGLENNADKTLGSNDLDGLIVVRNSSRSPTRTRVDSPSEKTDGSSDNSIAKGKEGNNNDEARSGGFSRNGKTLPKVADSSESSSVASSTENVRVSQMHRKERRRSVERPTALASKPPIQKQLTDSRMKLKRPESAIEVGRKGTPTSPTPARVQRSLPTSPRSRIPSFEEWKAKKSDDVAKQEKLKAQARQMIKEARTKSVRSQSSTATQNARAKDVAVENRVPATGSLPRLTSSKKYKAPEPPGVPRQESLASKLKDEIEYQKKITEKTRKTLESSRIKRINPKQENVAEVEQRSERSEKVQQAIREAKEKPRKKAAKSETVGMDSSAENMEPRVMSPPKPPRAYTYAEEPGFEERGPPQEPGSERRVYPNETGTENQVNVKEIEIEGRVEQKGAGTVEQVDFKEIGNESVETQATLENASDDSSNSLQQNPFKLTFKKKESVPQAVVKPLPATVGRDTKIDLKKYSIKSRSETLPANIDGQLSNSRESLSERKESSEEEDVNDILDNIGDVSENGNKTDDEFYDNAEEEEGFQDTSQYVEHEIAVLEEDRIALDRVAVKLEKELREAMNTADCKEEEQRLFQEWFLLVNKRNEIVRRQTELSILEKEENLEKRFELLNRELRFLMTHNAREKTPQEQKREELLLAELVRLVNKRDELVRIEDSQVQEAEKAAQHVEHVVRNTKIPKKQGDCCVQ